MIENTLQSTPSGFRYSLVEARFLSLATAYTSGLLLKDKELQKIPGLVDALTAAPENFVRGLRAFAATPDVLGQADLDAFEPDFEKFVEVLDQATAGVRSSQVAFGLIKNQVPISRTADGLFGQQPVVMGPLLVQAIHPVSLQALEQYVYLRVPSWCCGLYRGQLEAALLAFSHHPFLAVPQGLHAILSAAFSASPSTDPQMSMLIRSFPMDGFTYGLQSPAYDLFWNSVKLNADDNSSVRNDLRAYADSHPYVEPTFNEGEEEGEEEDDADPEDSEDEEEDE